MLPHVTDQVTPAFALSLATVAVNDVLAVAANEDGGALSVTEMGPLGALTVMLAEADLVVSLTEVAVIVTVAGLGMLPGAVNLMAVPLAVELAEKLPHCELPQVTDHLTPSFALSLLTTAVRLAVELVSIEDGACGLKVTEIPGGFGGLGEEPAPPHPAIIMIVAKATMRQEE